MSLTPWLPTVRKIKDGEPVDQATVNPTIDQLAQREQHLYEKFEDLLGKSVLISFDQPIHPDETLGSNELNIVYFSADNGQTGVKKGITGFSSTSSSSVFAPNDSNYVFGLVKAVYPSSQTVDIFTEGLCELSVNIDDPSVGLLESSGGVMETFRVGPYYLSRSAPGKITKDPAGIPVYVGYALSRDQFLLHPNVDEFSQFFINYRYHVLDRVAGKPTLSGGTWTIADTDRTKVGWIPADTVGLLGAPAGATFYYNIPILADLANDSALTASEKEEAGELKKYLPPVPSNFIQLTVNGLLQRYNDVYDTGGVYSVNEYGLWWHGNTPGLIPWASNYPASDPANWVAIQATVAANRQRTFVSFAKFNPALRTQLVSSLAAFNTSADKTNNFIKFYSKDTPTAEASTGDLLVKIIAGFDYVGYNAPTFTYPTTKTSSYTSNRAIANLKYSPTAGKFSAVVTPVVAKIEGSNGITAVEKAGSPGVWSVSYLSQGMTGEVDSIEPINSRLEFRGLSSYIKLPPPSATPYGLIGKILLPKGYPSNQQLNLLFHLFGDTAGASAGNVALHMEYSVVTVSNSASPETAIITANKLVTSTSSTVSGDPAVFNIASNYTQYEAFKLDNSTLSVPASRIAEDSIVNFKITRVTTASSYIGNIGILGIYWEIPNN